MVPQQHVNVADVQKILSTVNCQAPNCRNQATSCDNNEAEIISTTASASYPTIDSASNLTINTDRNTVSTLNSNLSV
ncbi:hypothetical protein GJ496_011989 [Pomphorhynchus laevis]|nr:hypothetical protein GJ496_011989 [Pomphorhynchus laevis]